MPLLSAGVGKVKSGQSPFTCDVLADAKLNRLRAGPLPQNPEVFFPLAASAQILLPHTANSIVERLGLSGANMLYRWKQERLV